MKLLLDQNVSTRLVGELEETFQGVAHVRDQGLESAEDAEIWSYAGANGYIIVTKDADCRQRSFLLGPPPKVVRVRLGNCSTDDILELLREHEPDIRKLEGDPDASFLAIP